MFRTSLLIAVGIGTSLVILGWIFVPSTSILSIAAALLILVIYALLIYFVAPRLDRRNPQMLRVAGLFGWLAAIIFVSEILWEYAVLPTDNTRAGLIEFGSVFALYFLSALLIAYRTQQTRQAILTAVSTAMIASLIWLIAVLAVFYIFQGSPQQTQVFRAEGNYADFAQSGMNDFNRFIMEDFFGAGFFHLLLGPVVAGLLGTLGSLLGKGLAKLHSMNLRK